MRAILKDNLLILEPSENESFLEFSDQFIEKHGFEKSKGICNTPKHSRITIDGKNRVIVVDLSSYGNAV